MVTGGRPKSQVEVFKIGLDAAKTFSISIFLWKPANRRGASRQDAKKGFDS
jgi:hypothetical protein